VKAPRVALWVLAAAAAAMACAPLRPGSATPTLREAYRGAFLLGGTLNAAQFTGRDSLGAALAARQFSAISPENVLKWESVHPRPGEFDFSGADRYVAFGERHAMFVVGHTLVWHNQTPRWVFQDSSGTPVGRDTLVDRLHTHIATVVGRYRGRIKGWDVVNEALNEDGTMRETPWYRIIGPEYIAMAFRWAREADPDAELYYNDYSLERPDKRAGALALLRRLRSEGVPVTGVGLQGHHKMDWPTRAGEDSMLTEFAALGLPLMITELDIDVLPRVTRSNAAEITLQRQSQQPDAMNPYPAGLPDSLQHALAKRYAEFFDVYLEHRAAIRRVTFWGVADGDSWLNDWPVRGRTNYPLLFDRSHRPKPAFDSVIAASRRAGLSR
jgi:endo-1,4-beta-xylanase